MTMTERWPGWQKAVFIPPLLLAGAAWLAIGYIAAFKVVD